jgi:hypothetical protein
MMLVDGTVVSVKSISYPHHRSGGGGGCLFNLTSPALSFWTLFLPPAPFFTRLQTHNENAIGVPRHVGNIRHTQAAHRC